MADAVSVFVTRHVNSFLGALRIIETVDVRAISANGIVRDIEVLADLSNGGRCSLNRDSRHKAYYRHCLRSHQAVSW